jgi:hypothetical protein
MGCRSEFRIIGGSCDEHPQRGASFFRKHNGARMLWRQPISTFALFDGVSFLCVIKLSEKNAAIAKTIKDQVLLGEWEIF